MSMTKALMIGHSRLASAFEKLGTLFQGLGLRKDGSSLDLRDRVVFEETYLSNEHGVEKVAYICFVKPYRDQRVVYIGKSGQPLCNVLKLKKVEGKFVLDGDSRRDWGRTRRADRWVKDCLTPVGIANLIAE